MTYNEFNEFCGALPATNQAILGEQFYKLMI